MFIISDKITVALKIEVEECCWLSPTAHKAYPWGLMRNISSFRQDYWVLQIFPIINLILLKSIILNLETI